MANKEKSGCEDGEDGRGVVGGGGLGGRDREKQSTVFHQKRNSIRKMMMEKTRAQKEGT